MRLLLLTNVFPNPWQPTKGSFNLAMARALAQQHSVRVVSPVAWVDEWNAVSADGAALKQESRQLDLDGLDVHYPRYYYPPKVLRTGYGWFLWHSVRSTVLESLEQHRPDAVISYWAHPDGAVALRAARLAGVPAVVMVGGSDVLLLTGHRGRRRKIVEVLSAADAVVAVSRHLRTKVLALGVAPEKVHVVYRGVDRALFSPGDQHAARRRLAIPADTNMILWVGRMVPVKGLDILLDACKLLQKQSLRTRVYLVGDGPLHKALVARSRTLGLQDVVSFAGAVPQDELPSWYRAADLTVLPSRSEGVPNVLLESLACGTPFVATGVGGVPEICGEDRDQLVAVADPEALAKAMQRALAKKVHPSNTTAFEPASWESSVEGLVQVIDPLVRQNGLRYKWQSNGIRSRVHTI